MEQEQALETPRLFIRRAILVFVQLAWFTSMPLSAGENREETQQKLDAAREQAREARIAPLRQEKIEAWEKKRGTPKPRGLQDEYSCFAQHAGKRPAMFSRHPEVHQSLRVPEQ